MLAIVYTDKLHRHQCLSIFIFYKNQDSFKNNDGESKEEEILMRTNILQLWSRVSTAIIIIIIIESKISKCIKQSTIINNMCKDQKLENEKQSAA